VSLSPEDELRFLNIVGEQAPHILPFVQFSLAIPSRKSELVTARRTQVDLVGGTLMIPAKVAKARRPILKPLPPAMLPYFRNLPVGCEWAFYRQERDGTYSPLGDFKKCFKRCCELAGVPWMRVHDLRHFAAQRLAARGVPEVAINAVAGWSNNSGMLSRHFGETPARVLSMIFEEKGAKCEAQCEAQQALAG